MNGRLSPLCPVCGGSGKAASEPAEPADLSTPGAGPCGRARNLTQSTSSWSACTDCAHAWQPNFNESVLREIYRSHYYTPAPAGIGVQFRNDFLAALESFRLNKLRGCCWRSGHPTATYLQSSKADWCVAHVCVRAEQGERGHCEATRHRCAGKFFGSDAADEDSNPVECIYARHVIEHVFDFGEFFKGVNAVVSPDADLILETPSLDFHAVQGSIAPFHVEHVHVFALRSLARLAAFHGWRYGDSVVTASGNLIASFKKGRVVCADSQAGPRGLQAKVARRREAMRQIFAGRRMIFWGAGSAGIALANTIGRDPDIWTDGNPNKIGKKFVGSTRGIVSPESAIAAGTSPASDDPILVITSSFQDEILPRVRQLGWSGAVFDAAGNRL